MEDAEGVETYNATIVGAAGGDADYRENEKGVLTDLVSRQGGPNSSSINRFILPTTR